MKIRDALGEASRNLRAGTAGALALAVTIAVLCGVLGGVDVATYVAGIRTAHDFRASGATIQTINLASGIDGAGCESLAGSDGTSASGALRQHDGGVHPLALPGSRLDRFDVTPGLLEVLAAAPVRAGAGVWLSSALASDLGVEPGDMLSTTEGEATVAGIYPYLPDGRDRIISYAVLVPTATDSTPFDACWMESWPPRSRGDGWTAAAVLGNPEQSVTYDQLNTTLGTDLDLHQLGLGRSSRHAAYLAALVGVVLGAMSIRRRRLEIASALHSGVPRVALTVQLIVETTAWAVAGAFLASPAMAWLAADVNPAGMREPLLAGLRVLVAGAAAAPLGAFFGTLMTREAHLFRYFKER